MSGLEIVGAVASAAQLADLCLKVLKSISCLYRNIQNIPTDVSNSITRINQLGEIAQLVSSTPSLHSPVITATVHEALDDVEKLLDFLDRTSHRKGDNLITQQLQNISHILHEPAVQRLLGKLESTKVTLSLCIDAVNSQTLHSIGIEVRHIRHGSDQLSKSLPEIHDNVRKTLTTVEDLQLHRIAERLEKLTISSNSTAEKITDVHRMLPDLQQSHTTLDSEETIAVSRRKPSLVNANNSFPGNRCAKYKITARFCTGESD
jgi:hypothetical protein